jgi:hypothetical protein
MHRSVGVRSAAAAGSAERGTFLFSRRLVTGGAGFIGSNLSTKLVEDSHSVRIIDDLSTGLKKNVPAGSNAYLHICV